MEQASSPQISDIFFSFRNFYFTKYPTRQEFNKTIECILRHLSSQKSGNYINAKHVIVCSKEYVQHEQLSNGVRDV